MILAITGHREIDVPRVQTYIRREFEKTKPSVVVCGLASGSDLIAGEIAISMGIEVWSAKPWTTHTWRKEDQILYQWVETFSSKVHIVTEVDEYPGPWVYHKRNEWMVDNADCVMGIWNGIKKGGTWACLNYTMTKTDKKYKIIDSNTGEMTYGRGTLQK